MCVCVRECAVCVCVCVCVSVVYMMCALTALTFTSQNEIREPLYNIQENITHSQNTAAISLDMYDLLQGREEHNTHSKSPGRPVSVCVCVGGGGGGGEGGGSECMYSVHNTVTYKNKSVAATSKKHLLYAEVHIT